MARPCPYMAPRACAGRKQGVAVAGMSAPDGVPGTEPDPLGNRPVLLLGLGQLLLDTESLVALLERAHLLASECPDAWALGTPPQDSEVFNLAIVVNPSR